MVFRLLIRSRVTQQNQIYRVTSTSGGIWQLFKFRTGLQYSSYFVWWFPRLVHPVSLNLNPSYYMHACRHCGKVFARYIQYKTCRTQSWCYYWVNKTQHISSFSLTQQITHSPQDTNLGGLILVLWVRPPSSNDDNIGLRKASKRNENGSNSARGESVKLLWDDGHQDSAIFRDTDWRDRWKHDIAKIFIRSILTCGYYDGKKAQRPDEGKVRGFSREIIIFPKFK